jgi:hypothetical protein
MARPLSVAAIFLFWLATATKRANGVLLAPHLALLVAVVLQSARD